MEGGAENMTIESYKQSQGDLMTSLGRQQQPRRYFAKKLPSAVQWFTAQ